METSETALTMPLHEPKAIPVFFPTLSGRSIIILIANYFNLRQFITRQGLQILQHYVRQGFLCPIHIYAIACYSQKGHNKNNLYQSFLHKLLLFYYQKQLTTILPYLSFQRDRQTHCLIKNNAYLCRPPFCLGGFGSTRFLLAPTNKDCRVPPFSLIHITIITLTAKTYLYR